MRDSRQSEGASASAETGSRPAGFDPARGEELALRCEQTTGNDVLELINLECDICAFLGIDTSTHETPFTSSFDAAIKLLPETAINHSLSSFYGHRNNSVWGETAWHFLFHDTAQLMGKRAAKEKIARMEKIAPFGREFRGPPRVAFEKAIAEHFVEFFCRGAATPALAICSAALRARALASVDTLPKGQDAQQGLAGTESGAVPLATDAQTQSVSPLSNEEKGGKEE